MRVMAWVIEGRRSDSGRALPSSRIPQSPLLAAILAIAAVSLFIAFAFALAGAWLVLPFAGLELAGLAWALRHAARCGPGLGPVPGPGLACAARTAASRSRAVPAYRIRMMIDLRRKPS